MSRLLPALAVLTLSLSLIACDSSPTPPAATIAVPAASTSQAGVTLRLPAPSFLSTQYLNPVRTTRIDVQLDGGATTAYILGSAQAPCAGGFCTLTLSVAPGLHTFTVSSYGVNTSTGQTVMISQGSVTQTLATGQNTSLTLTLTPVDTQFVLSSAVKQYNHASKTFGNYVQFTTLGGRSLPAYYDFQTTDSVGDTLPSANTSNAVLCGDNGIAISNISDSVHPHRFRVEVQTIGRHTLSVQAGTSCVGGGAALATQAVSGALPVVGGVAAGASHSLALLNDHTLRVWGNGDSWGSSTLNNPRPVGVSNLNTVISVAGGRFHTLAVKADGTVQAWGNNGNGQLGDGTTITRTTPGTVPGLTGVVSVAGGYAQSLALKVDGTVRTWGLNQRGQLGDGSTTNRSTPVVVNGLTDVISLAGGDYYSLALRADGTVRTWGQNNAGQLGDGTFIDRTTPVAVSGLTGVVSVASGYYHALALKVDGTVQAWGYNDYGQLGDGTTINRSMPVTVPGLTNVISLAGGFAQSLAVKADSTVQAWGYNGTGGLGDGTLTNRSTPGAVSGLTGVVSVAGGSLHSLALKTDGTMQAWGANDNGQLGDGTTIQRLTPVAVVDLSGVQQPSP